MKPNPPTSIAHKSVLNALIENAPGHPLEYIARALISDEMSVWQANLEVNQRKNWHYQTTAYAFALYAQEAYDALYDVYGKELPNSAYRYLLQGYLIRAIAEHAMDQHADPEARARAHIEALDFWKKVAWQYT